MTQPSVPRVITLEESEVSDFNEYHRQLGLLVDPLPSLALYYCQDRPTSDALLDLSDASLAPVTFHTLANQVQDTGNGHAFHYTLGRDATRQGNLNNVLARAGILHPSGVPYDVYEHGIYTYGADKTLTRGIQNATTVDNRAHDVRGVQLILFSGCPLPSVEDIKLDDNDIDTSV